MQLTVGVIGRGCLGAGIMPRPLNQKDTSCLSLEAVTPPGTETNEVLEGLRTEKPQDTSWHLPRPREPALGWLIAEALPAWPRPVRNVGASAGLPQTDEETGLDGLKVTVCSPSSFAVQVTKIQRPLLSWALSGRPPAS